MFKFRENDNGQEFNLKIYFQVKNGKGENDKEYQGNFFKDRHYLLKELEEMKKLWETSDSVLLLDAGWGVGNAMFPLCHLLPRLKVDAFDFAK